MNRAEAALAAKMDKEWHQPSKAAAKYLISFRLQRSYFRHAFTRFPVGDFKRLNPRWSQALTGKLVEELQRGGFPSLSFCNCCEVYRLGFAGLVGLAYEADFAGVADFARPPFAQ